MEFTVPSQLGAEIDTLLTHYPQKRSAALMVLHALQEHFGFLSAPAVEWTAAKLELEPINIYELVTFYPMFRQEPIGEIHFRVCRTLSCALGGAEKLRTQLCQRLGLDVNCSHLQTRADRKVSLEWVECLAGCGRAPVMMCNDTFHEAVTPEKAEKIMAELKL